MKNITRVIYSNDVMIKNSKYYIFNDVIYTNFLKGSDRQSGIISSLYRELIYYDRNKTNFII
jgi:hypothetical protein